jgi:hypothetical protein
VALVRRDALAWNIGLDHNQWIRWLNPSNSFVFSAQQFWYNLNGLGNIHHFDRSRPFSVLNDKAVLAGRKRAKQRPVTDPAAAATCAKGTGSRNPCSLWNFGEQTQLTTLAINTQYLAGNVRPNFVFFYDWSGSYLLQPGIDWTFWDPFRLSIKYNFLEGRGNAGLGILNNKDNVWVELQYLLY